MVVLTRYNKKNIGRLTDPDDWEEYTPYDGYDGYAEEYKVKRGINNGSA